jgi:hypothetical protein
MPAGVHHFDTSRRGPFIPVEEFQSKSPQSRRYGDRGCPVVRQYWVVTEMLREAGRDEFGGACNLTWDDVATMFLGAAWPQNTLSPTRLNRLLPMPDPYDFGGAKPALQRRVAVEVSDVLISGYRGQSVWDRAAQAVAGAQESDVEVTLWTVRFDYPPYDVLTNGEVDGFNALNPGTFESPRYLTAEYRSDVEYQRTQPAMFVRGIEETALPTWRNQPAFTTGSPGFGGQVPESLGRPSGIGQLTVKLYNWPAEAVNEALFNYARGSVNKYDVLLPVPKGSTTWKVFPAETLLLKGYDISEVDFFPDGRPMTTVVLSFAERATTWLRFPNPPDGTLRYVNMPNKWADPDNPAGLFLPQVDHRLFWQPLF